MNFEKWNGGGACVCGLDCSCSGYKELADSFERGHKPSVSIKCGEFD
jgi:hypothetical protein